MKKIILLAFIASLNFVSCSSDDIQQENQQILNGDEVIQKSEIYETEPVKDKTRD